MILADLTERKIQECVKIGITADFADTDLTKANFKRDGCDDVTKKDDGVLSLFYQITLRETIFI